LPGFNTVSRRSRAQGFAPFGCSRAHMRSAMARLRCGVTIRSRRQVADASIVIRNFYEYFLYRRSRRSCVCPSLWSHTVPRGAPSSDAGSVAGNASERTKPTYRFINKCGSQHLSINVALPHMWRSTRSLVNFETSGCGAPHNAAQRDRRNSISLGLVFHEVRPALRLGGTHFAKASTSHQDPAQHKRLSYRGSHVRASLGSCSGLSQSGASA